MDKTELEGNNPKRLGPRIWRGVTLQLFLVAVLPLTVLVLIITFGSLRLHHEAMRSLVSDRNLLAVQSAAVSLSKEIDHLGSTLQIVSKTIENEGELGFVIDQVKENLDIFDGGVAAIDAIDGSVIFIGNSTIKKLAESQIWPDILNAIQLRNPGSVNYFANQTIEDQTIYACFYHRFKRGISNRSFFSRKTAYIRTINYF